MKPTLIILAAGMASRYGSLKQIEGIGPNNETIMDYSIFDAIKAGFGKVIFVIRESFANDFKTIFNYERFNNQIEIDYVYQELNRIPEGFTIPNNREKPWGTNHAVLMAANLVKEPFAVINADDFYGSEAFTTMANYLISIKDTKGNYAMISYKLINTLSDNGSVSRGVCSFDSNDYLLSMIERTSISKLDNGNIVYTENEETFNLESNLSVSMNFFGFTPDYFDYSKLGFTNFLQNESMGNIKEEYFIPKEIERDACRDRGFQYV